MATGSNRPVLTGRTRAIVFGAIVIAAIVTAIQVGALLTRETPGPDQFKPSAEVLKRYSPPGYTPYGQPPRPGEVRPPFRAGQEDAQ